MAIDVLLDGKAVPVDEAVFRTLLDSSVAGTYKGYAKALDSHRIKFSDLVWLAEKGDIPYSLFFAPFALVQEQVKKKTEKLLAGLGKDTFSIGSRSKVELRDVELIVEDLIRKQQLVRKHDKSLQRNKVVGVLRDDYTSIEADAARLMAAIGLSHEAVRACKNKDKALDLMIDRLEANQVLVSRSVQHYMPQRLTHVKFSGMTIRDAKVPFIFLAGGYHGDDQEPAGRTLFTLALMTVLVARRIFAPMTWDGGSTQTDPGREYDIAAAMLMPRERFRALEPTSLGDMRSASDEFKVTPSAVAVRAMKLGTISAETATGYLAQLREEFRSLPRAVLEIGFSLRTVFASTTGRSSVCEMLHALDNQSISPGEFCRAVCLNHLKPSQVDDLRRALG